MGIFDRYNERLARACQEEKHESVPGISVTNPLTCKRDTKALYPRPAVVTYRLKSKIEKRRRIIDLPSPAATPPQGGSWSLTH